MHAERLRYLEVTLCEWLFRAIESAEVLPISRDYFRLRRPLDRRLYELARKHCGQQGTDGASASTSCRRNAAPSRNAKPSCAIDARRLPAITCPIMR